MPRGWDQRFEETSAEDDTNNNDTAESGDTSSPEDTRRQTRGEPETDQEASRSDPASEASELNIRHDWEAKTVYIEPTQDVELTVAFTELKSRVKQETGLTIRKNQHFFRGIFASYLNEHQDEITDEIVRLAREDSNTDTNQ